jgi:hypothetical protein
VKTNAFEIASPRTVFRLLHRVIRIALGLEHLHFLLMVLERLASPQETGLGVHAEKSSEAQASVLVGFLKITRVRQPGEAAWHTFSIQLRRPRKRKSMKKKCAKRIGNGRGCNRCAVYMSS